MFSNNLALGIFFLYFVLMSGECYELINCGLQRYINNNVYIKHVMMFLSIYIFTYILNWYTIDSINEVSLPGKLFSGASNVEEDFEDKEEEEKPDVSEIKRNKIMYIFKSFLFSAVIYLMFILSSKNEGAYLFIFLIGMLAIVFGSILKTTINPEVSKSVGSDGIFTFITPKQIVQLREKHDDVKSDVLQISILQNIMTLSSIVLVLLLLFGSYKYYLRQYAEHRFEWSWLKFWFGTRKCASLQ